QPARTRCQRRRGPRCAGAGPRLAVPAAAPAARPRPPPGADPAVGRRPGHRPLPGGSVVKTLPLPAVLLAALAAAPAFAATPIDETRALDPRGSIEVSNVKGRIEVRAWDRPEVRITGSLGDGVERLQIEGDRRSLEVKVRYPHNSSGSGPTTLVLDVPQLAELEIDGVAVDIDVQGVAGRSLEIDSVSGDIVAVGAPREASIESVSGNLRLNLNSHKLELESRSDNIPLRGRIGGEIAAETVSGDIRIDTRGEPLQRLATSSVSGNASY